MKTVNKNIIIFAIFIIMVLVGFCGQGFQYLTDNLYDTCVELQNGHVKNAIRTIKNLNDISTKKLLYHDQLVDINSVKCNLLRTSYVKKRKVKP